jgi:hypothetical protein
MAALLTCVCVWCDVCDVRVAQVCGCTDLACTGPRPKGEEHNRRWVVYQMPAGGGRKGKGRKGRKAAANN